jgi:hypothetical protein
METNQLNYALVVLLSIALEGEMDKPKRSDHLRR